MVLKGGRIASQSPLHNSSAPGITAASVDAQQFCAHCADVMQSISIQLIRQSREDKNRKIFFCKNCWTLIAGEGYIPDENDHPNLPYYCSSCDEGVEAGDSLVSISTKSIKFMTTSGFMIFHDQCFLNEAGVNFWD